MTKFVTSIIAGMFRRKLHVCTSLISVLLELLTAAKKCLLRKKYTINVLDFLKRIKGNHISVSQEEIHIPVF